MKQKEKKRLFIWPFRIALGLSLAVMAAATLYLLAENHTAAQLTAQGIPDLRDPTRQNYWLTMMASSLTGMLSILGLNWADPSSKKKASGK